MKYISTQLKEDKPAYENPFSVSDIFWFGRSQAVISLVQTETCHSKQAMSINRRNLHHWKYNFLKALKVVKAQQILQRVAILKNDMIFSSMGG